VYPSSIPTTEILYATDFSEPSRRALACARQIARRRGAVLRAIHVVDLMGRAASTNSSYNAAIETARRSMRSLRRQLRLAGIRENSTIIPAGSISLAIRDAAVRYHATLLVMGLHGDPGISAPTLGGNVRRLIRSTPCPMLTVGMRGPDNPAPTFERVLFVTDMSADSVTVAQQAWHLDGKTTPVGHFAVLPPDPVPESSAPLDVPPGLAPLCLAAHHQAAGLIVAKAAAASVDLIVLALRRNSYLDTLNPGSVVRAILSKADCPVLIAHASGEPMAPLRERFAAARNREPQAS
jgi:nucleotide-binding universal stress UspA family protein